MITSVREHLCLNVDDWLLVVEWVNILNLDNVINNILLIRKLSKDYLFLFSCLNSGSSLRPIFFTAQYSLLYVILKVCLLFCFTNSTRLHMEYSIFFGIFYLYPCLPNYINFLRMSDV